MSLRTQKVGAVAHTPDSTKEHPDRRRHNRIRIASEYTRKVNISSESIIPPSPQDVLEISAEGIKALQAEKDLK